MAMPNFTTSIVPHRKRRKGRTVRPFRISLVDQLGEGELAGELPPPPPLLGEDAGDVTTGLLLLGRLLGPLPNQFHRVKPKKSRTSTSSAINAAAMPAPAPLVSPPVSTTSE